MSELSRPPRVEWIQPTGPIRSLLYWGEPYHGRLTRVFAYFAVPEQGKGPFPAMVLVHGGNGRAFPEWATMWAQRGYAAIAMDLSGNGPNGDRMQDGGPAETDQVIFYESVPNIRNAWAYHAVSAVIRAVSFLRNQPEVDPSRIGVTGISWGGVITCIVAGLDQRIRIAIPVYGCGYLDRNSVWKPILDHAPAGLRKQWIGNFDPSQYLRTALVPMLWITGTNDFAFPLDSYQASYRATSGPRWLRITPNMPHGHREGWEPIEITIMADQVLRGGTPLPKITQNTQHGDEIQIGIESAEPITEARLIYTLDASVWRDREWKSIPLSVTGGHIRARLPPNRPITYFANIVDLRGAVVSSEHRELMPVGVP